MTTTLFRPNHARRARVGEAITQELTAFPGTHYLGEFASHDAATDHARERHYLTRERNPARCVAWILPYSISVFQTGRAAELIWTRDIGTRNVK